MGLESLFEKINFLRENSNKVFIYGFGSYGRNLYKILQRNEIMVDGFVVTTKSNKVDDFEVPIYLASEFFGDNIGYILALNEKNYQEVNAYLCENLVEPDRIINAGAYLEQFGNKRGMNHGSIEITTTIGCKIDCKFCPQKELLRNYFKNNKRRKSYMDIDTFKKCLDYFPNDYDISFGGMSEPFLNGNAVEMLKMACHNKRNVSLYTTLVGIKEEQVEDIISLPLNFVVLHVADKYGYANIERNESYYKVLKKIVNAKKNDGTKFVNMCNAQAEPDKQVNEICKGKYEILTEMTDRAGNLKDRQLIHNYVADGKIVCSNYGSGLNNNILLPDGSVVLCCMDFGLKHILGNIFENSYEQLMNGSEMLRIKEGMNGNTDINILCRTCSYARKAI